MKDKLKILTEEIWMYRRARFIPPEEPTLKDIRLAEQYMREGVKGLPEFLERQFESQK